MSLAASAHSTRSFAVFCLHASTNSGHFASATAVFCFARSVFCESAPAAAPAFLNSRSTRWSRSCLHWSSDGALLQPAAARRVTSTQRVIGAIVPEAQTRRVSFIYAVEVVAAGRGGQDRAAIVPIDDGLVIVVADGAGGTAAGAQAAQAIVDA